MLAGMRSCFLLSFFLAFSLAACLPVQAQVNGAPASVTSLNGVAPSVTSMGFGGKFINGVSPSVTSLGPNGYGNNWSLFGNCCSNFFWPANPNLPQPSGHHHHHRKDHDHADLVGVIEPAYVPYPVPDVQGDAQGDVQGDVQGNGDDSPAADYVHAPRPSNQGVAAKRAGDRDSVPQPDASVNPTPDDPAEPVAAQPSTVLVFKDGHQSDVLNYAIVGDTLFDFDSGRTRKILLADLDLPATQRANDDRGVDFQIPARSARQ
jgi:hypothetical protein